MKSAQSVRRTLHGIASNWILYLFVLPAVAYYIIFHYVPIYGIQIAFQDYRIGEMFGASQWAGLKHFLRFFESAWFGTVMRNTLSISLLSLAFFPMSIILALLLNEVQNMHFRKLVQTMTYAPHFISMVVLCGAVTMFLSPSTGLIGMAVNAVRGSAGKESINLLSVGSAFKWIYVLSGVWQGTGWSSIIYFAALCGVVPHLMVAAVVDGAN